MIITTQRIKSLIDSIKNIEGITYVAIDQGQCDTYMDEMNHPPIKPPAVLIAVQGEELDNDEKGGAMYTADLLLRFYINLPLIVSQSAPERHLAEYDRYLNMLQSIIQCAMDEGWKYRGYKVGARIESLSETRIEFSMAEWVD